MMKTYANYLLVKQASSLFTPHQRMAMQIGRMFERTKGKSQASQQILGNAANRGPMSMNDIALQQQQKDFQKQQDQFSKEQEKLEKQKQEFQGQADDIASRQREMAKIQEELDHRERMMKREIESHKREVAEAKAELKYQQAAARRQKDTDGNSSGGPDPVAETINNHARESAKRVRNNLQRLLRR